MCIYQYMYVMYSHEQSLFRRGGLDYFVSNAGKAHQDLKKGGGVLDRRWPSSFLFHNTIPQQQKLGKQEYCDVALTQSNGNKTKTIIAQQTTTMKMSSRITTTITTPKNSLFLADGSIPNVPVAFKEEGNCCFATHNIDGAAKSYQPALTNCFPHKNDKQNGGGSGSGILVYWLQQETFVLTVHSNLALVNLQQKQF